ncbi:conserved hypothetical protein [Citreicella sp. SE45]|nr:conserved hypothetical protein [Citreicella sp. SE45]
MSSPLAVAVSISALRALPEPPGAFGAAFDLADPDVAQRRGIEAGKLRPGAGAAIPEGEKREWPGYI